MMAPRPGVAPDGPRRDALLAPAAAALPTSSVTVTVTVVPQRLELLAAITALRHGGTGIDDYTLGASGCSPEEWLP
jgi:hypothetical protein